MNKTVFAHAVCVQRHLDFLCLESDLAHRHTLARLESFGSTSHEQKPTNGVFCPDSCDDIMDLVHQ